MAISHHPTVQANQFVCVDILPALDQIDWSRSKAFARLEDVLYQTDTFTTHYELMWYSALYRKPVLSSRS
jgi:hypothetical protein